MSRLQEGFGGAVNWQKAPVESFCQKVLGGGTPLTKKAEYYDGDVPWLRTQEVVFNYIQETNRTITVDGLQNSSATWIPKNSVIVAMFGASAGRVAINTIPLTTNQACCNLVIDPNKADYRYVFYALRNDHEALESQSRGSAQNNLNAKIIREFTIPSPPVGTQRRIADFLQAYDNLIENNRRRIQLLEQAARLLYKEWFVHLRFPGHEHTTIKDGVPKAWQLRLLGEICTDVRESIDPKTVPSETPYIGLEHMPRRAITLDSWGSAGEVESNKFKYSDSDILFGKIRPYFHKVGFTLIDGIVSSDAIVIRPTESHLSHYVLFLISSDEFIALASKTVREGSKMPRADWKFLLKTEFRLPPAVLLALFNGTVAPICSQLRALALQNRQLTQARDLLLPRLMNGEVFS